MDFSSLALQKKKVTCNMPLGNDHWPVLIHEQFAGTM